MSNTASHDSPAGYSELVRRNRNFRLLWCGQIVSLFGDWFNLIASAALVALLTKSGFAVGGLFVIRMLALFLISPIAGVVADRYDRKVVLVWTDFIRGFTVLGFLLVRDANLVWLLYALTAAQQGVSGIFFTVRTAILPDIVEPRAVGTANAITSATWSTMLAVGAAAGGLVAGALGIYAAYVIDALTYFVSAVFISRIRLERAWHRVDRKRTIRSVFDEYTAGLRLLGRQGDMLLIALQKAMLMLFFGSTFHVVQVALAERLYGTEKGSSLGVGILFAAIGVGTGISPLMARVLTSDREERLRWAILCGYLIGAVGLVVTSSAMQRSTVVGGSFLVGLGNGLLWVFSTHLLLYLAPDEVRGRVFACEFAFFTLASAAGSAVAGAAIDRSLGIATLLHWMAALSLIPAIAWGLRTALRRGHS